MQTELNELEEGSREKEKIKKGSKSSNYQAFNEHGIGYNNKKY